MLPHVDEAVEYMPKNGMSSFTIREGLFIEQTGNWVSHGVQTPEGFGMVGIGRLEGLSHEILTAPWG